MRPKKKACVYTLEGRRAQEWRIGDDRDSTGRTTSRLPCGAGKVGEVPRRLKNFVFSTQFLKTGWDNWIQTVTGKRSPDGVKR